MAGRPSKCTPARQKIICEAVRDCLPYHEAARLAGIDPDTLRRWMRRGEQGDKPYAALCGAIKKAEAEAQRTLVKRIGNPNADEAKGWQRWAWLLERRWPETWAQRQPEASKREEIIVDLVKGED